MRPAVGFGLLLAAIAGPAGAQDAPKATSWYGVIAEDGAWLGHGTRETGVIPGGRETIDLQELKLEGEGGMTSLVTERTVTRTDEAGRTVSIVQESRNARTVSRIETRFAGGEAIVTRHTGAERHQSRIALPPGVRFDGGAGLIPGWDFSAAPRLQFLAFNADAMTVERVTIERVGDPLADGSTVLIRKRWDGDQLRAVARLKVDPQGRIRSLTQPMFGTSITIRPISREEALADRPTYHVLRNAMVKSPFRVPPAAMQAHIRYKFGFRDGVAFAPPETSEQRVQADATGATLDICGDCGPGLATDKATLTDALRPTAWLQSDHPKIRRIVASVARMRISDTAKMNLLAQRGMTYMPRVDFNGHFSALETIERGAGDCTEAAVLLAALGRAAGIPTRVVNGLTYSRARYHGVSNVFMPHSWTLAFVDGHWRSFDMALLEFDSTHIALTVGDGDARSLLAASQLASLLKWDGMTQVKAER